MLQKILKTGNSLCVTIPASFAKMIGLKVGDAVEATVDTFEGKLTYTFKSSGQLSLLKKTK